MASAHACVLLYDRFRFEDPYYAEDAEDSNVSATCWRRAMYARRSARSVCSRRMYVRIIRYRCNTGNVGSWYMVMMVSSVGVPVSVAGGVWLGNGWSSNTWRHKGQCSSGVTVEAAHRFIHA